MKVASGKVVGGKVVLDDAVFVEGATVTVLGREGDESFEVTPEMETALLEAIGEADRGETVSDEEVLAGLRRRV
jgi:hypothetical protein